MTRGLKVVQEHWKKEPNQLWTIYHDYNSNFIRLSSVANPAYALDVVDGATYLTPFDEVKAGQKWRYKNGSGVLQNQGKSLDIPNGTHEEGAHLLAFHINHGATNQQWDIIPNQ
ncbi:unnamed protein product [Oikopleura dioica]|uniref:Ricin B lectin domain-containing protein n=1 Tax=Oikopleura dioica TaxID=34765 RepID=E4X1W1_OIKDI|nr:unnamed protein product [Oikopleura dioica]CBY35942.1 unnamed protein product [Oikopleura dioica]